MNREEGQMLMKAMRNKMKDLRKYSEFRAGGLIGNGSKMPKNCVSNQQRAKTKFEKS